MWLCNSSSASMLTPQYRLCLKSSTGRSLDSAIAASTDSTSCKGTRDFIGNLIVATRLPLREHLSTTSTEHREHPEHPAHPARLGRRLVRSRVEAGRFE